MNLPLYGKDEIFGQKVTHFGGFNRILIFMRSSNTYAMKGGTLELVSKRCTKCGIHPHPSEMVTLWGYDWQEQTQCMSCRRNGTQKEKEEALVAVVPKFKTIATADLRDWHLQRDLRVFVRQTYLRAPYNTRVYIYDGGNRFWVWTNWLYTKDRYTTWDDFQRQYPEWKVLEMPKEAHETPIL